MLSTTSLSSPALAPPSRTTSWSPRVLGWSEKSLEAFSSCPSYSPAPPRRPRRPPTTSLSSPPLAPPSRTASWSPRVLGWSEEGKKRTRSHPNETEGKEAKISYIMKPKSELLFNLSIQGDRTWEGALTGFIDALVDGLQHGMNKRYQEKRSS
ncbi:hypothetical protein Q3G72_012153 [Acer saccharum]|nr:hypothetical protein Q3G72_012153 [Acer saccharum]